MSIRWIRNVLVDGEASTLEILIGDREISDKCYVRIDSGKEMWFIPKDETRAGILDQGIQLLKNQFEGKTITYPNGNEFTWN